MPGELLSLLMVLATCGVLLLGFPVAFSLAGTAFAFAVLGSALDVFDLRLLGGVARAERRADTAADLQQTRARRQKVYQQRHAELDRGFQINVWKAH